MSHYLWHDSLQNKPGNQPCHLCNSKLVKKIRILPDLFNWRVFPISFVTICLLVALSSGCRSGYERAELVIANSVEPESLDPILITGQADARIVECLFEGLVRLNAKTGTPEPGLATHWKISDDMMTYTFFLRKNVHWSDGKPLTANDMESSWRRALDKSQKVGYADFMFIIDGARAFHADSSGDPGFRALSPEVFEVKLSQPAPHFLNLLTMPIFAAAPVHAIEQSPTRWILQPDVPVNGPYLLKWWKLNHSIRLEKNPNYWDHANTSVKTVDFLPISNPSTAMNLYLTGQVDIIWDKDLIPTQIVDHLKNRDDFHQFNYLGTYFIRFNSTEPPLDDPRVRKALSLSIDRERITSQITRAGEIPTASLVHPDTQNYNPNFNISLFDPEKARSLLAQAGFPNGKDFPTLEYYFNGAASGPASNHQKIAVELQAMWKKSLNINVRLKKNEWVVFLGDQRNLNYQISRSSWIGDYNDPFTYLEIFSSMHQNNRTGWKNSEYDAHLINANKSNSTSERENWMIQAESLLLEKAPIAPIYFYKGTHMWDSTRITGIYFNILDRHPVRAISILNPHPHPNSNGMDSP